MNEIRCSNYEELAHCWVRNSDDVDYYITRSYRMFSERDTIYSYGRHFAIARKVRLHTGKKKERFCYIINSDGYSVTTAKHKSIVEGAIPSYHKSFRVPEASLDHNKNIEYYFSEINDLSSKIPRARSRKEDYKAEIIDYCNELRDYIAFFEIKKRFTKEEKQLLVLSSTNDVDFAKILEAKEKRTKLELAKKRKKQKTEYKEALQSVDGWRDNENNYIKHNHLLGKTYLRVEYGWNQEKMSKYNGDADYLKNNKLEFQDAEYIKTSRNVSMKIDKAKVLHRIISSKRRAKHDDIDGYRVTWDYPILHIGCHKIHVDEINFVAKKLGWKEISFE